ncbi:hypothetical protein Tco_0774738 [Tanacetum coccineum]|uniref:Uncharacterized protein n=1 Tax=Tanacetum coccineum TaxID=301880 RepID=A0ABQ4ZQB2_9ASTR
MSSITAQQIKLDLELVPKEKRLKIGKCNERLNLGKIQREPTFQVVLDALALTPCYSAFLITADICPRVQGQDFDALPTDEEIMSFLRDLGHTGEINSLNDVVVDQMHQPWRTFAALINKSLSGKTNVSPEEPTRKLKRVTRPTKKSTKAPARGVVIRETLKMPLSKKKEKVDVARGKGIELLSDVELTKKAQFEEIQRKSMRDFHKTHPSGSGTITKTTPSAAKIKPSVINEGTGVKPRVPNVIEEDSSESEAES